MISKSQLLLHYKKREIREEMLYCAKDREVVGSFGGKGFAKRPDVLQYPNDILELVKLGVTSFHASEELWKSPLRLDPGLKKQELDELRIGWDLVIDIDCAFLEYSKIAAHLFIQALRHHDISSISCKFSGNTGFHIGVPFKAFPEKVHGNETRLLFPEGTKRIAIYLKEMIREPLSDAMLKSEDIDSMIKKTGKDFNELVLDNKFDPFKIVGMDTVLISSRHLYRMPYSFNEKSGLVSIPVDINKVLEFDKKMASSSNVNVSEFRFLDSKKSRKNEANQLIVQAFDFKQQELKIEKEINKEFDVPEQAVPEQFFPPCISNILKGLEDGKKRSLFVLVNFLTCVGWDYKKIEELLNQWNARNKEPLREVYIKGQIRYHAQQKKKVPPPNCRSYYEDFHVCFPDNLCQKIKNPVQYSRRKTYFLNNVKDKGNKSRT